MADEEDGGESLSLASPLFTPTGSPSAFGGSEDNKDDEEVSCFVVARTALTPAIPGLLFYEGFLDEDEAQHIVEDITACSYFDVEKGRDQAVLFGARDGRQDGLPKWARSLLMLLEERLRSSNSTAVGGSTATSAADAIDTLFNPHAQSSFQYTRQFILNVYRPGQGIASHVDLPHRFLDGIMILSFGHGIAMDFVQHLDSSETAADVRSIYLTPGSLCILTGESRWQWAHGIAARTFDLVDSGGYEHHIHAAAAAAAPLRIERGPRLSITIRWLKIEQDSGLNEGEQPLSAHESVQPDLRL